MLFVCVSVCVCVCVCVCNDHQGRSYLTSEAVVKSSTAADSAAAAMRGGTA